MKFRSRIVRVGLCFLLGLGLVFGIASCTNVIKLAGKEPLPVVSSLPNPKLPDWIEQISPLEEAEPGAQIRIRFKEALIPVEAIDSPDQQQLLKKFEVIPPLPGQFRFLTPRMVGFQAEQALPKATRFRVTLKQGLKDLKGHQLTEDLPWTFNTEAIKLTNLPTVGPEDSPIDIKTTLAVTSNVELDLASLQQSLRLIPAGAQQSAEKGIPCKVTLKQVDETAPSSNPSPQEVFDPSLRVWDYVLTPQQTLAKDTRYRVTFAPGLRATRGNLPSDKPFASEVKTYAPLAFQKIEYEGEGGSAGRFVKGWADLRFNNVVDPESVQQNLKITPAPKADLPVARAYERSFTINLNPWALEPKTTYTVTIEAGLKDEFGQTLGKPVTVQYETGDLAADIWAPSGLNIFPTGKDLRLDLSTVNLPQAMYKAAYRVVNPTDLVYADSALPEEERVNLLPFPTAWKSYKLNGQKQNQPLTTNVPLRQQLGGETGMLAYGFQARTSQYVEDGKTRWREPAVYGLVQLTNLGVFAQWFPESGLVRSHHLSDGSPVVGAVVEIYKSRVGEKTRSEVSPCATGKTDTTGTLALDRTALQQCIQQTGGNQVFKAGPELLVVVREQQDWAFTRTSEYGGAYGFGVDADWEPDQPLSRGTIFSDRQLYQPGEKAWFTGVAYYLQRGELKQDQKARYALTLQLPDGQKTDLGSQTTNEYGTFALELPLQGDQPLGYYTLTAKGENGLEISGEFRVAEFKPPNFKVDLNLDREFATPGQMVEAKAQSSYLFGAPVDSGKAQFNVTRRQTSLIPKGWEDFSFGRQWFWPEESPEVNGDVLQKNVALSSTGAGNQTVMVGKDLPYPMTYQVDVQVADVSNLSVSNSKSFIALPDNRLIGLQSDFVAEAGKPFSVQVIVTDPTGNVQEGESIQLELQLMKYSSIARVEEGSRTAQNQVQYQTVGQAEIRSGNTPQTVSLTPTESGSYRLRANLAGAKGENTATDLQIWATGANTVNWGNRYRNDRLEVKLDKKTYQVGETATALIQSPYPAGDLYFAVIRHGQIYQTVTKVQGGAPQVKFLVTPEMLPNAAVQAVLVRQGDPLPQLEPGSLENLVKIGFAPFSIETEAQYLKVQATPARAELEPAGEQTLKLELKTAQDKPVKGQVTVMVVNEAILQLTGYRPPDLVKTVYAEQPISMRFADNRPNVILEPQASPIEKGWGYGGGESTGAAGTRVRKKFQPLAYYKAVETDAAGQAEVTFTLPDDLTTWRVLAVATTIDRRFGNGEATFLTTQPLLTNPILPQFARPGDRLLGGLSVTNTTGQTGSLSMTGTATGPVQFEQNNQPVSTQSLQTPVESGTKAYRFPMTVITTGKAQVQFSTQLGSGASDAFEVPLEVRELEVTEQAVATGVTENQVRVPLNLENNVVPTAGGLEVNLASSLMPQLTAPARQSLDEEQLPFLEPIASQLSIAANLQRLSKQYGQTFATFNPTQQAAQSLERLRKLQKPDGGFAAWPGLEKADPFITPYAAEAIAQARAAGLTVEEGLVKRTTSYLKAILANPGQFEYCKESLCRHQMRLRSLMALAALGDRRTEFLAEIVPQAREYDQVTQIKLARYLAQFPDWQAEAQTLSNQIQETISETGRSAAVNLPPTWRWLSSPTAAQAQALRLFIAQPGKPEVVDRLLQGLLNLRREGTWATTYDNAAALTALVEYGQLQPTPPDFKATVQLAGQQLAATQFQGYRNPSLAVTVPMAQLPKGKQEVVIQKSGQGKLHYLVAYRYRLQGHQPGKLNGLRVSRELRPAGETQVLRRLGLYAPDQPLKVEPGQIFDVGLEIITDHPVDHVVITDPLPAGFEAVDSSFQTAPAYLQAQSDSWKLGYQTIYRDRVVAFGDRLEPGVYQMHYLVRSVTPGQFLWPGAEAHLQYAPEEFGRSASSMLEISDRS
ncbi:hypothetical protein BST81_08450 [Leptolyngbya sp. 'hensonii']|uniref:alpha-2-macroglobulin family protein n=1 Tax=Leptolyngbya sp. 'hensonii' TaxID=1922337 RepID=UPI00094F7BD2|nr:alpha-2-macroglobulin [Leptolyngbya sp. 'hensonii']OLP18932.1 hypothetical protein BST81_08450 [Leptolyngbya sp. 'hensonii']